SEGGMVGILRPPVAHAVPGPHSNEGRKISRLLVRMSLDSPYNFLTTMEDIAGFPTAAPQKRSYCDGLHHSFDLPSRGRARPLVRVARANGGPIRRLDRPRLRARPAIGHASLQPRRRRDRGRLAVAAG